MGTLLHAVCRVIRLDYETITDCALSATSAALLFPLLFPLIVFLVGTVGALALSTVLTVGYWALSTAGLFVSTSSVQCGRLSALLPVTRSRQVVGRYLSAGILGLICLVEMWIQMGLLWLIDVFCMPLPWQNTPTPMSTIPLSAVVGGALAVFVLIVSLEMPFYYALEFTKASSWFWSSVFVIAAAIAIGINIIPDNVQDTIGTSLLALPGYALALAITACCIIAVTVSYMVSHHIWLRKEF